MVFLKIDKRAEYIITNTRQNSISTNNEHLKISLKIDKRTESNTYITNTRQYSISINNDN